jgi:N-acetyl-beta-hexosaminidase
MRKILLLLVSLLALATPRLSAQTFPTLSDGTDETWYYLLFNSADDVIATKGEGAIPVVAIPTGRDAQLWKIEGSAAAGYTLTSRSGQQLYVDPATYSTHLRTAAAPTAGNRFNLTAYGAGYEIIPTTATSLSLNPWGGNSIGAQLALYYKNDANAVIRFVKESDLSTATPTASLIPYPADITAGGDSFDLKQATGILYCDDDTHALATTLAADLQRAASITLPVGQGTGDAVSGAITFGTDTTLADEAYRLHITADGIHITAAGSAGFFYALKSLRQLLPAAIYGGNANAEADWSVSGLDIVDAPALQHRGFMLDVSRHFFTTDEVKKLIDVAADYKLNRFHWHLTDDQGWRIEIPEYPLLTEVGAVRSRSLTLNDPTAGVEFYDDTEYGRGCYYTLDELRDVVDYARERHVEIIPEVDMPGHMVAAIAAYPELSCDPTKTYEVRVAKGISSDVLNIGNDHVINFLKCVIDHVCEVFPGNYIHLGGDECPTTQWSTNAECLQRISDEGLSGVEELQPWLLETLGTYISEKYGKEVIAWNDLQTNWRSDYTLQPIMMAWTSTPGAAAAKGFRSIAVPTSPLYFDLLQASADQMEIDAPYMGGYGDGSVNAITSVYNYNPLSSLSTAQQSYCLGTQANLWTESCSSNEAAEYCLFPRLLALSETAWLPAAKKSYNSFYQRLQKHSAILDALQVRYAGYAFEDADVSTADATRAEAAALLEASTPGAVGHPTQEAYDALYTALGNYDADGCEDALSTLTVQIAAYKNADITLPQAGKLYQIVSAATYYKNRYEGSTVYEKNGRLFFHYTPQLEPEEIWSFLPQSDGSFLLQQAFSENYAAMDTYNAAVTLGATGGTTLRIAAATTPTGSYSYLPGVVTLTDAGATEGSSGIKRFYGNTSGMVIAYDNAALCYPGTWRLEEVTDFTLFVQRLADKCSRLIATATPDTPGQPTTAALTFLNDEVLTPANAALQGSDAITQDVYEALAQRYQEYLDIPKASYADCIREDCYYYIANAYHTTKYAKASGTQVIPADLSATNNAFRWQLKKQDNGNVIIISKSTGKAAYIASEAADQTIRLGRDYEWTLQEVTTDLGTTAVAIIDGSGTYSWYANPSAWNYLLTKPYDWGASIWTLTPIEDDLTGIAPITVERRGNDALYDLSGRRVYHTGHGIYLTGDGQKILK